MATDPSEVPIPQTLPCIEGINEAKMKELVAKQQNLSYPGSFRLKGARNNEVSVSLRYKIDIPRAIVGDNHLTCTYFNCCKSVKQIIECKIYCICAQT